MGAKSDALRTVQETRHRLFQTTRNMKHQLALAKAEGADSNPESDAVAMNAATNDLRLEYQAACKTYESL